MTATWLLLFTITQAAAPSATAPPDWASVIRLAHSYSATPNCENATALVERLPDFELEVAHRPDYRTVEALYRLMPLLESRMFYGDSCAAHVAFRLTWTADAAFSEDLGAALGSLATNRPNLFLTELASAGVPCDRALGFNTDFTAQEFTDERQLRIKRLREFSKPDLDALRIECLTILERES